MWTERMKVNIVDASWWLAWGIYHKPMGAPELGEPGEFYPGEAIIKVAPGSELGAWAVPVEVCEGRELIRCIPLGPDKIIKAEHYQGSGWCLQTMGIDGLKVDHEKVLFWAGMGKIDEEGLYIQTYDHWRNKLLSWGWDSGWSTEISTSSYLSLYCTARISLAR